jgi:hypothetical protein
VEYDERLSVPWWWWPAAAGLVALLGAEIYAGLGWLAAVITYVALGGAVALALVRIGRHRVRVNDGALTTARRTLALSDVSQVRVLDGDARRVRMGPSADIQAVLVTRPWINTAVELTRRDGSGDAPYWLVSTRRPEALAAVVRQACGAPSQHGSI